MNSSFNNAAPSFNEIVFEQRNKLYGAFQLRKEHDRHLLTGFIVTGLFVVSLVLYVFLSQLREVIPEMVNIENRVKELKVIEIILPDKPVEAKSGQKSDAGTNKLKKSDLTPDPTKQTIIPPVEKENTDTAAYNPDGKGDQGLITPGTGGDSNDTAGTATTSSSGSGIVVRDVAEVMPEFPGGIEKMYAFLGKHLKYPNLLKAKHIEGTVYVSFVVMADGEIGNIEILKTPDAGFNEEVTRVISKMPNWKPGQQAGQKVPVRFRMPIKFTLR